MNLKNRPPIFVPEQLQGEIEKLSKAALMDMVWDLAARCAGCDGGHPQAHAAIMSEIRKTAEVITGYRDRENPRLKGRYLAKEDS